MDVAAVGSPVVVRGDQHTARIENVDDRIERALKDAGVLDRTTFTGPLAGADKAAILASSELMVLPTHSENFGVVIAEALASATPVITTVGTPWSELSEHGCGWYIQVGAEPLYAAMREAMGLDDAARREMGRRGRELIRRRYDWQAIASDLIAVYNWILGRAP